MCTTPTRLRKRLAKEKSTNRSKNRSGNDLGLSALHPPTHSVKVHKLNLYFLISASPAMHIIF